MPISIPTAELTLCPVVDPTFWSHSSHLHAITQVIESFLLAFLLGQQTGGGSFATHLRSNCANTYLYLYFHTIRLSTHPLYKVQGHPSLMTESISISIRSQSDFIQILSLSFSKFSKVQSRTSNFTKVPSINLSIPKDPEVPHGHPASRVSVLL